MEVEVEPGLFELSIIHMGVHLFKKLFLEGTGTSCSWSVLFISSNRNMSISNWLLMVVDRLNLP